MTHNLFVDWIAALECSYAFNVFRNASNLALIPNCDTHVLNNVFNVITYLVKQMSANLIHIILINIIQNAEANLFFKINCATVTKNIKLHILQNKSKQISNHILLKTAYTQRIITRFSKIILHDLPFLAYEHSEGKRAAISTNSYCSRDSLSASQETIWANAQ